MPDISIFNEGSMFRFHIGTEDAREWIGQNVQLEGWQWMGNDAFAVDARFAPGLVQGMQADGLEVE